MAQFSFSMEQVCYLRERFQVHRFIPLALMLYLGCMICTDFRPAKPLNIIVIILLLLSFRLMDDLFDLQSDRKDFPERTLSGTDNPRAFAVFLILLFLLLSVILLLEKNYYSLLLLFTSILVLYAWYAKLRYFFNSRMLHTLFIHAKYPMFIYMLAPGLTRPEIPGLVYLTFLLFEMQDDPKLLMSTAQKEIRATGLLVYLALLLILLELPSESISNWAVILISIGLQSLCLFGRSPGVAYFPFINTLGIFIFLSARRLLQ
jgi:hypothetical protein